MSLFERLVTQALRDNFEMAPLAMIVEKEILHHDILRVMSGAGLLEQLTFMGGTCLRACYGSNRLSEDLDFTGGKNFSRKSLQMLPTLLIKNLQTKYGLIVEVREPQREIGNVDTWKMKVVTRPEQRGIPAQRINIDICAIPSYDARPMMLRNYYGIDMGTSGLIVHAESREEILADKLIALALRPGRIKNRDLWDIGWLKQHAIQLPMKLVRNKIFDHQHTLESYVKLLFQRRETLKADDGLRTAFEQEMKRFLPAAVVNETILHSSFWQYLTSLVVEECDLVVDALSGSKSDASFTM
ncbi:MAG TPA: nucleotidyl transferase AbiEii/AbiGii toxin family protein [Desulfuromonadales bacterium]|nr:nucleotidyl transferase AbiEii/AbiGii toxin family protein [Desulfuromonadales bacterium]